MDFELRILGTAAALPTIARFTTSQALTIQEYHFLIDCGEGAQIRMDEFGVKKHKFKHIFISHLHGDHYFGLFGLMTTYSLYGRRDPLTIYSPPGLKEVLLPALQMGQADLGFPLYFVEVDPERSELIFENAKLEVHTLPLHHRIPTCGYLFREKERLRNIRSESIAAYDLSVPQIKAAKRGEDIRLSDGRLLPNAQITLDPPPVRAFAFCSDTRYKPDLVPLIRGVDLLYHESTFCRDHRERAEQTQHSTAEEAAQIARQAGVGKLILGHFSSRYEDAGVFEAEARRYFPESYAARDGDLFSVEFAPSEA